MARGKEGSGLEKWTHHSVELIRWWSSLLINSKWDGISMFGEKNDGHYVNFLLPNFQHIFFLFSFTFTGLCFYGLKYGYGQKGKGFFLGGVWQRRFQRDCLFVKGASTLQLNHWTDHVIITHPTFVQMVLNVLTPYAGSQWPHHTRLMLGSGLRSKDFLVLR